MPDATTRGISAAWSHRDSVVQFGSSGDHGSDAARTFRRTAGEQDASTVASTSSRFAFAERGISTGTARRRPHGAMYFLTDALEGVWAEHTAIRRNAISGSSETRLIS